MSKPDFQSSRLERCVPDSRIISSSSVSFSNGPGELVSSSALVTREELNKRGAVIEEEAPMFLRTGTIDLRATLKDDAI